MALFRADNLRPFVWTDFPSKNTLGRMGEHQQAMAFFLSEAPTRFGFLEAAGFRRESLREGYVQGYHFIGRHVGIEVQMEIRDLVPWVYVYRLVNGRPPEDLRRDVAGRTVRVILHEACRRAGVRADPASAVPKPRRMDAEQEIVAILEHQAAVLRAYPKVYADRADLLD